MAAKRPLPPTPSPKPIDKAYFEIKKRYPGTLAGEFKGLRSVTQAVQQFQDVVAESALVDKYSNRTLMAAAAKLAKERFVVYGGRSENVRQNQAPSKTAASKMAKKKMK
jgi:hypothetical protein